MLREAAGKEEGRGRGWEGGCQSGWYRAYVPFFCRSDFTVADRVAGGLLGT